MLETLIVLKILCVVCVKEQDNNLLYTEYINYLKINFCDNWLVVTYTVTYITGYGSTLYIGIAMVFVFSPYIWKFTFCFQFQVNLTFNDFIAQNMSKVICVPNISLNYHFLG